MYNAITFQTVDGRSLEMPVAFPSNLDPRFDFVKSDEDLARLHDERVAFAIGAAVEMMTDHGKLIPMDPNTVRLVTYDLDPMELIDNPPTVAREV